jgi:hypothetical protein
MDLGLKDDVAKRHGHDGKIIEVVVMTLSFREPCAVDAIMAMGGTDEKRMTNIKRQGTLNK